MAEILTVGLLAAIDLWLALPAAFAMPIPAWVSALVMAVGGSIGAMIAAFGAFPINGFLQTRYSKYDKMVERTSRFLNKYGLPGIGLSSPVVLGPLLTTVIAIILGAHPRKLMIWIVAGAVLWSFIFYLALLFGASFG